MSSYTDNLTPGLVAAAVDKLYFKGSNNVVIKDGLNHSICDFMTSNVSNLSDFIPTPSGLAPISNSISNGVYYALVNKFVSTTSPFGTRMVPNLIYAIGCKEAAIKFVDPMVGGVANEIEDVYA